MKSRINLKGKKLYVNEDLTRYNMELFTYARRQKFNVWTTDGKILVKHGNTDKNISRITCFEDFAKIIPSQEDE